MDTLIAKLTNLGYEFFGILVPGGVLILGLLLLGISAGEVLPAITAGVLLHLTFDNTLAMAEQLVNRSGIIAFAVILAVAYFFGHLLTWIARGGRRHDTVGFWTHLIGTMQFRPPKLNNTYSPGLETLFQTAGKKLLKTKTAPNWTEFYPVAKMYVMQKASYSLVPTYQNKYTLHRAFAVTAAIVVWGCLAIAIVGGTRYWLGYSPGLNWLGVISLLLVASLAVWGFSSSYLFYWSLWGDYLITETYALLRDEKENGPPSK